MRYLIWIILAIIVFWLAAFTHFVAIIPRNPVGDLVTTQAVVVLTGGSLRIAYGFELLEKQKAKRMFITGVGKESDMVALLDENQASSRVRRMAEKGKKIVLGYEADSTRGNAEETARWMKQKHFKSMRLVTSNYHLPRSLIEFRRAMPDVIIIPDPVFPEEFQLHRWWDDGVSRNLLFSEFHKYLAAWLFGELNL